VLRRTACGLNRGYASPTTVVSKDRLEYDRAAIVGVLRDLNQIVVSLARIGSASAQMTKPEFDTALAAFVFDWDVTQKLAHARAVLSEPFSHELGPDDMEELEREMEGVSYWRPQPDGDA